MKGVNTKSTREMQYMMVIEQTSRYPKRMRYNPQNNSFSELEYDSLMAVRNFTQPYGWIKESGTPPQPHWDVLLMAKREFHLGDDVPIKVIGVFKRKDGDHKYVAVEVNRNIDDFSQLSDEEKSDLNRLYPRAGRGEEWFGKDVAVRVMNAKRHCSIQ